tara:strand:+ start:4879 stop:5193 length:315 start_codon:yes stop_codon:yes gene_type:complete
MNSINAICKKFNLPEEIDAKIMSFSTHPVAQLVKNEEISRHEIFTLPCGCKGYDKEDCIGVCADFYEYTELPYAWVYEGKPEDYKYEPCVYIRGENIDMCIPCD